VATAELARLFEYPSPHELLAEVDNVLTRLLVEGQACPTTPPSPGSDTVECADLRFRTRSGTEFRADLTCRHVRDDGDRLRWIDGVIRSH
jgi:hypothetical protein